MSQKNTVPIVKKKKNPLFYFSTLTLVTTHTIPTPNPARTLGTPGVNLGRHQKSHYPLPHKPAQHASAVVPMVCACSFDPNQFLLQEHETVAHSQGRATVRGLFWTSDGRLLASSSQEAIVEPDTEPSKL